MDFKSGIISDGLPIVNPRGCMVDDPFFTIYDIFVTHYVDTLTSKC